MASQFDGARVWQNPCVVRDCLPEAKPNKSRRGHTRNSLRLRRLALFLRNWLVGLNQPIPLAGLALLPRFLKSWAEYSASQPDMRSPFLDTYPCLADRISTTPFDPHYFYQSAWLARCLRNVQASRHLDIGSSVMAIGVLSGFVETIFVDYRPLQARQSGLLSVAGDITRLPFPDSSVPSLSCLHVLEHVGLGRYGDRVDPKGSEKAAAELVRIVMPGSRLYLSVPVGRERVCFNAHRVFSPYTVVDMFAPLKLDRFSLIDDDGRFVADATLDRAKEQEYGCGLFELRKQNPHRDAMPG